MSSGRSGKDTLKASIEGDSRTATQEVDGHDRVAVKTKSLSGSGDKADVTDEILQGVLNGVAGDGGADLGLDEGSVKRNRGGTARARALHVEGRRDVEGGGEVGVENEGESGVRAVGDDGDGGEVGDEDGFAARNQFFDGGPHGKPDVAEFCGGNTF